jgi:HlyD family secretion protein
LTRAAIAQLQVQRAEIARLHEIVAFQRARHDALRVRALHDGVVQEIPSETGQWINPGQTLVKLQAIGKLKAMLRVPEAAATDVGAGQSVIIDTRNGVVRGRVVRVNPGVQGGVVMVDVALPDSLPRGARPDLSIDGVIEVERVPNALHVGRSPEAEAQRTLSLFRITADGKTATRVPVAVGRVSTTRVEIVRGLRAGDVVIISKVPVSGTTDRIRIKH